VIELAPERIASEAGGEIVRDGPPGRPARAQIDSRELSEGELFFGIRGAHVDGGEHAAAALEAGAWGAVVDSARAAELGGDGPGWVFSSPDPLAALQRVATAWRRELACPVVGITGSTGKTSVKDIARALLPGRVHASPENFNTEIGLPLTILSAPPETELLVLEMAMRGIGQIAELCEIAEPDVAAITNVGPVHLELLGTVEAIAEAKAEILDGLGESGRAVIPADADALEPHLSDQLETITFGPGGEVFASRHEDIAEGIRATIVTPEGEAEFELPFTGLHNLANTVCAVAIGVAVGAPVEQMARRVAGISLSRLRGELIQLPGGSMLVNDCYNANPISMRAALDHLATLDASGRRIAVLGGMGELGPDGPGYHREAAAHARGLGIDAIVGVGELARDYAPDHWAGDPAAAAQLVAAMIGDDDALLVKGSRSVGLEVFTAELQRLLSGASPPATSRGGKT
jgi:UDP-N-acetylmuramoyl-tripeptide--D-alanyl-D-alanine ligase